MCICKTKLCLTIFIFYVYSFQSITDVILAFMSIYLMVFIIVFYLYFFFILISVQDLETIKCQLTQTLIKYIPVQSNVTAACRPWLEDENRWHIHFKWKQKMNLMLHIIFDPTQTINKNPIHQSRIFGVCSDVNTAKKKNKSYKIFISCSCSTNGL